MAAEGCGKPLGRFKLLGEDQYDAAGLDIGELGEIGYALLSRLRASPALGIVVIGTALGVESRLRCLQSGADICLPDPVDNRELACVLLALARRLPGRVPAEADGAENIVENAGRWEQIGGASCRARVCPNVSISDDAGNLKKNIIHRNKKRIV